MDALATLPGQSLNRPMKGLRPGPEFGVFGTHRD